MEMTWSKMGPLAGDHPLVLELFACEVCHSWFTEGQYVTLVPTLPADEEEWKKMGEGRPYTAEAIPVHWNCRPQEEDD